MAVRNRVGRDGGPDSGYTIDQHLMQACRQVIEPQLEAFRSAGALGPPLAVPAGASDQTRFLSLLGRTG